MRKILAFSVILLSIYFASNFMIKQNNSLINKSKIILSDFTFFKKKIVSISIENNSHVSKNYLVRSLGFNKKDEIYIYDQSNLKNKLDQIVEIENYSFELKENGNLIIKIKEKEPFLIWVDDGKKKYVDNIGNILRFSEFKDKKLIQIVGERSNIPFYKLPNLLKKKKIRQIIKKIYIKNNENWIFLLNDNKCIDIPTKNLEKIINIFDNIRNLEVYESYTYFDMRIANRIYLSNKECSI